MSAEPTPSGAAAPADAGAVLRELEALLQQRRVDAPPGSYSAALLTDPERVQRKIMEEAFELCLELGRGDGGRGRVDAQRAASEAADLLFHTLVALVGAGVALDDVLAELARRRRTAGPERAPRDDAPDSQERP